MNNAWKLLSMSLLATLCAEVICGKETSALNNSRSQNHSVDSKATSRNEANSSLRNLGINCPNISASPILLPNQDNCNEFYICRNGQVKKSVCMHPLIFDAQLRICVYAPDRQNCTITTKTSTSNETYMIDFGCLQENKFELKRDPSGCNAFYQCYNNVRHRFVCPYPLHFDDNVKVCDFPHKVDCTPRNEVAQNSSLTEWPSGIGQGNQQPVQQPDLLETIIRDLRAYASLVTGDEFDNIVGNFSRVLQTRLIIVNNFLNQLNNTINDLQTPPSLVRSNSVNESYVTSTLSKTDFGKTADFNLSSV